jgi:hypothetical protein
MLIAGTVALFRGHVDGYTFGLVALAIPLVYTGLGLDMPTIKGKGFCLTFRSPAHGESCAHTKELLDDSGVAVSRHVAFSRHGT